MSDIERRFMHLRGVIAQGQQAMIELNWTQRDVKALDALDSLAVDATRILSIAQHLWQMVPPEVWRENGAEWMGQYEGDHHAEQIRNELMAFIGDDVR